MFILRAECVGDEGERSWDVRNMTLDTMINALECRAASGGEEGVQAEADLGDALLPRP